MLVNWIFGLFGAFGLGFFIGLAFWLLQKAAVKGPEPMSVDSNV